MGRLRARFVIAAGALTLGHSIGCAADQCRDTVLVTPRRLSEQTGRPVLAWMPLPNTSRYRLQIESRIPNGPVLARIDQIVSGTEFIPPRPLADERAVVKVRISAACGLDSQGTVSELPPSFFIDARSQCPAPENLRVRSANVLSLSWKPRQRVSKTEISIFSAIDGRLLAREDAIAGHREFPPLGEAATVALRNRCADSVSETVYRVLSAAVR